jgi:hypothetical protein
MALQLLVQSRYFTTVDICKVRTDWRATQVGGFVPKAPDEVTGGFQVQTMFPTPGKAVEIEISIAFSGRDGGSEGKSEAYSSYACVDNFHLNVVGWIPRMAMLTGETVPPRWIFTRSVCFAGKGESRSKQCSRSSSKLLHTRFRQS